MINCQFWLKKLNLESAYKKWIWIQNKIVGVLTLHHQNARKININVEHIIFNTNVIHMYECNFSETVQLEIFYFLLIFFYFPSFLRCKCKYNILFEFCSIITFDVWHQCKNRTEKNFAINSVVGSWDTFTIIVVNSFSFSLFYWFIHCLTIFFQRIYFIFSFIDSLWILSCTLSVLLRSSKIRGKAKKTILRLDL